MPDLPLIDLRLLMMGHFGDDPEPIVREAPLSVLRLDEPDPAGEKTILAEFLAALAERTGVTLTETDIARMETVGDLCEAIAVAYRTDDEKEERG